MITPSVLVVATLVLVAGTFAFRFAGPVLRARVALSPRFEQLIAVAAVVLLAALVSTSPLFEGPEFVGFARPVGVLVGGVLAWRKAPLVVIVVAAGVTAALLRVLGVP